MVPLFFNRMFVSHAEHYFYFTALFTMYDQQECDFVDKIFSVNRMLAQAFQHLEKRNADLDLPPA